MILLKNKHFFLFIALFLFSVFIESNAYAYSIDTLNVYSPAMDKELEVVIIKPEPIKGNATVATGLLFLLHGYDGDAYSWLKIKPDLGEYVDRYGIAIICPDGANSWYWDSPFLKQFKYETFITKELYPHVTKLLQFTPSRSKVAVTGLSMGGHGAFWLAAKHPKLFGAIGSMSGGLDLRSFKKNWNLRQHLGSFAENMQLWNEYTVISYIENYKTGNYKIIFDCGTSDFFYDANVEFHRQLLQNKVPHDFISRPGAHNAEYWSNAIEYQLLFFYNFFNQ